MVLVFHNAMTLCAFEAIHDLQHDSQALKSILDLNHVSCPELQLRLVELVCHDFALPHKLKILLLLEDARHSVRRNAHDVFLNIIDTHMALAKDVTKAVHVSLDEKSEHKLIKALNFNTGHETFLIVYSLYKVRPKLIEPLNNGVSKGLPSNVGPVPSMRCLN